MKTRSVRTFVIGMVLLASPLVGAAAAGVVLRWQEIQESRSAATTATTSTTLTTAGEPPSQTEPREESVVTARDEMVAPPTTAAVTHREAEIAALEAEIAARLADASPEVRRAVDVEALQAATSAGDRNRVMSLLARAEAEALMSAAREAAVASAMEAARAHLALNAADRDVIAMAGSALQDALDTQDWPRVMSLLAEAETRTAALRVHPNVHDEGVAMLEAIVVRHEPEWPWVRSAWDATDVRFYDPSLPGVSAPAAAVSATPDARAQMWFTLDVLRPSDGPSSEPRRPEDTLLHELGHVWDSSGVALDVAGLAWLDTRNSFHDHYAGCRRSGLADDQLIEELLVDAIVMITRDIAHRGPGWHNGNFLAWAGYYDPEGNRYGDAFGYYDADGFTGCLVDGTGPPQHLMDAIREALSHEQG